MNMKDRILDLTKKTLVLLMLGHVLHTTLEALPKEKALGPNGGYKVFSKLVGCDKKKKCEYDATFNPKRVFSVQGHIRFDSIIIKGWEGKLFVTSYSTLLNVTYKIFTKALQMRLQPIFMEVISCDWSTFLPSWFTLNNILLTDETM